MTQPSILVNSLLKKVKKIYFLVLHFAHKVRYAEFELKASWLIKQLKL